MKVDFKELFPGRNLKTEWKSRKGSDVFFPPVKVLPHITVDLDRLQDFFEKTKSREHSVFEDEVIQYAFGERYCSPKNYWPFIVHLPSDEAVAMQKAIDEERDMPWGEHQKGLTPKKRIRSLINLNSDYDPIIDERNYTKFPDRLRGTYLDELLSQFKAPPVRARFVQLGPGQGVDEHIDYNPKYTLKVHIPVYTHRDAVLTFDGYPSYHLPGGNAFLTNTGIKHSAKNNSKRNRVHLIVSLDGQQDAGYE